MSDKKYRIEHDSMGELQVPEDALWGAQTQRAVDNFPISGLPMPRQFIAALGLVKWAAAGANAELGLLKSEIAVAIQKAALEVAEGGYDEHFPIDVFQTGSGTSSNMNARARPPVWCTREKGRRGARRGQDRANAPDGCHAGDTRPGARRLALPGGPCQRTHPRFPEATGRPRTGWHRRGDGNQRAPAVRREGRGAAVGADGHQVCVGCKQVRVTEQPGRGGRNVRPAACTRGEPDQDRQ